ncbi:Alpha/Beta hydrolase protein [Globomyces pollinis-pini]|nr:Alpha/Beta hydrolase protein [Globomyces pollinis-pini]
MEALFQFMTFEELDENEPHSIDSPSESPTEPYYRSVKNVIKIVRTASSLALGRFGRGKKVETTKRAVLTRTVHQLSALALHQVTTVLSGVKSLVSTGTLRPSWDKVTHFGLHFIRSNMNFQYHTMGLVRFGQSNMISMTPSGVTVEKCEFVVDRSKLVTYERDGRAYQQSTECWRYPVPVEDPLNSSEIYTLDGEWVTKPTHSRFSKHRRIIYYIHGGAYILGNAIMYRNLTGILAKNTGIPIFAINYRLAPENPFPAALHDALAGYLWLIDPQNSVFSYTSPDIQRHEPYAPQDIIISGDSAGGGLAMALLNYLNMYLRDKNTCSIIPLPRGAILLSPWVDLSCTSKSWSENQELDFLPPHARKLHEPVFNDFQHPVYSYCFGENTGRPLDILSPTGSEFLNRIPSFISMKKFEEAQSSKQATNGDDAWIQQKMGESERDAIERFVRHPLVSPIFGEFKDLPPILIQAGECELLRDETVALAYKYKTHNKDSDTSWIRHEMYCDMIHDFQLASAWIPAASLSIKQFVHFTHSVLESTKFSDYTPLELTEEEGKLIKMVDSHCFK